MTGSAKLRRLCLGINKSLDSQGSVSCRNAGGGLGAEKVYRYCELCFMQGCISSYHHLKLKLFTPLLGQWHADEPSAVRGHEIDDLGSDQLGGADKITLVLPVLVINHDNYPAFPYLLYGLVYGIQCFFFNHFRHVWWVPMYPFLSPGPILPGLPPVLRSSVKTESQNVTE